MKTLVLQLARLGDIYQTWPVLRALTRTSTASDEIHLLVRDRFKGAANGVGGITRLWTLDTSAVLGALFDDQVDVDASLNALDGWLKTLAEEGFDRVINLSFSPFSSRLVASLTNAARATKEIQVRGYTRHSDGFFDITDDASAYFYAQAGPGRDNRVHLTDLFAHIAGVELIENDWRTEPEWSHSISGPKEVEAVLCGVVRPIVIHIGASQTEKSYGSYKWLQVVKGLVEATDTPVVLVGSREEKAMAGTIAGVGTTRKPIDLIGQTSLEDLYKLIKWAKLVIGADSAPVHIAALTGTPVLNLSFEAVNFWETGPKSAQSRILRFPSPQDLPSDIVIREALAILENRRADSRVIHVESCLQPYVTPASEETSPGWEWLQAIYMGTPFPVPESELCAQALQRLFEANTLAIEQLKTLRSRPQDQTAMLILERFDEIIDAIAGLAPTTGILVRWFQTERIRFGPMANEELVARTEELHLKLQEILQLYNNGPQAVDNTDGSEDHDNIRVG